MCIVKCKYITKNGFHNHRHKVENNPDIQITDNTDTVFWIVCAVSMISHTIFRDASKGPALGSIQRADSRFTTGQQDYFSSTHQSSLQVSLHSDSGLFL